MATRFSGKKVGVCVSGGLDSKTVCKRLVMDGIDVLAFSADLGQPDETDINNVKRRMATTGVETVIIDLKDDMAEGCYDIIQAQAKYDGGYWAPHRPQVLGPDRPGGLQALAVQGRVWPRTRS